jgi:hypothetical protein
MLVALVVFLIGVVCATSGTKRARSDDPSVSVLDHVDLIAPRLPQPDIDLGQGAAETTEPPTRRRRQSADDTLAAVSNPGPAPLPPPPSPGVNQAMPSPCSSSHSRLF